MKNIAVLIHDDAGQAARLQAALDVTRAVSGHLTAIGVTALIPVADDPVMGMPLSAMVSDAVAQEADHLARIEAQLAQEDVPWTLETATGDIAFSLTEHATLADLVVVNTAFDEFPGHEMTGAVAALIRAGRAVLAVPVAARGIRLDAPVLVAWDGSDEVDAALRAAVPLLAHTTAVHILCIDHCKVTHAPEQAARYLSRHDIHAEVITITQKGDPATTILDQATGIAAGMIVMGGYGQPRLFESLFGGVTQHLLEHGKLPLFLAH